jgi:hypothetical protein
LFFLFEIIVVGHIHTNAVPIEKVVIEVTHLISENSWITQNEV